MFQQCTFKTFPTGQQADIYLPPPPKQFCSLWSIPLIPVPLLMVVSRRNRPRERYRFNRHRLLHESVEELASGFRSSAIESERELIEVVIQLLSRHNPLMNTQQPALQQGRHQVDTGQKRRDCLSAPADHLVLVPATAQPLVTFPSVRDHRGSRFDGALHERQKTLGGGVRHRTQTDASDAFPLRLRGDHYQDLVSQVSTVPPGFHPTSVRFIHLDVPDQSVPVRPDHGAPEFLQAGPSGLVVPKVQQTLQTKHADAVLLIGDQPDGAEPSPKRKMTSMDDRPGRHRDLVSAVGIHHQGSLGGPVAGTSAPGATEVHRSAQPGQVDPAVRLRCKSSLEFGKSARIVLHALYYNIWWLLESSEYPSATNY